MTDKNKNKTEDAVMMTPEMVEAVVEKRLKFLHDEMIELRRFVRENFGRRIGKLELYAEKFGWDHDRITKLEGQFGEVCNKMDKLSDKQYNAEEQTVMNKAAIASLRLIIFRWKRKAELKRVPAFVNKLAAELEAKIEDLEKELENDK